MDTKRKGEIALLFLKYKLQRDKIQLGKNTRREICNIAKEIGVDADEAVEFIGTITHELVEEVFPQKGSGLKDGVSCEGT